MTNPDPFEAVLATPEPQPAPAAQPAQDPFLAFAAGSQVNPDSLFPNVAPAVSKQPRPVPVAVPEHARNQMAALAEQKFWDNSGLPFKTAVQSASVDFNSRDQNQISKKYAPQYQDLYSKLEAQLGPIRDLAKDYVAATGRPNAGSGYLRDNILAFLANNPANTPQGQEARQLLQGFVAKAYGENKTGNTLVQQGGEALYRGLGDVTASTEGFASDVAGLLGGQVSSGMSPEDQDFIQSLRSIRDVADPIKSDNFVKDRILGLVRNAPTMVTSALVGRGAGALATGLGATANGAHIARDIGGALPFVPITQQSIKQEAMARGLTADQARGWSLGAAPILAAAQSMAQNRILGNAGGSLAGYAKGFAGMEAFNLGSQLTGIAAQASSTDNKIDWKAEGERAAHDVLASAFDAGVLSLAHAGADRLVRKLSPEFLGQIVAKQAPDAVLEGTSRSDVKKFSEQVAPENPRVAEAITEALKSKQSREAFAQSVKEQIQLEPKRRVPEGQPRDERGYPLNPNVETTNAREVAPPVSGPSEQAGPVGGPQERLRLRNAEQNREGQAQGQAQEVTQPAAPKQLATADVRRAFPGRQVTETPEGHEVKIAGKSVLIRVVPEIAPERSVVEAARGPMTDEQWAQHQQNYEVAGRFTGLKVKLADGTETTARAILLSEKAMQDNTLSHEQVHLAKSLGLITDAEWSAMTKKFAKGVTGEKAIEEAVARGVQDWQPSIKTKFSKFVDRILKLVGVDRVTAEGAIAALREGEVFQREKPQAKPADEAYQEVPRRSLRSEIPQVREKVKEAQEARAMRGEPVTQPNEQAEAAAKAEIAKDREGAIKRILELGKVDTAPDAANVFMSRQLMEEAVLKGDPRAAELIAADAILGTRAGRELQARRDPLNAVHESAKSVRGGELKLEHGQRDLKNATNAAERKAAQQKIDDATAALETARKQHNERVISAIVHTVSQLSAKDAAKVKDFNSRIADGKRRGQDVSKLVAQRSAVLDAHMKAVNRINAAMQLNGFDNATLKTIGDNPLRAAEAFRLAASMRAGWTDKAMEYWYQSILSGPATQARNILGNTLHQAFEHIVTRSFESLMNLKGVNSEMSQFKEWGTIKQQFPRAFGRAVAAMKLAWATEAMPMGGINIEGTGPKAAIGGKTGRIIRAPGRAMTAMDAFASTLAAEIEVHIRANRIAEGQGLKPGTKEHQAKVDSLIENLNSPAWEDARNEALRLAFREKVPQASVLGRAIGAAQAVQKIPGGRFVIPFVETPARIFRAGYRLSPVAVPEAMYKTYKAIESGDVQAKAEAGRAWARIGAGGLALFAMLASNNPDDPWMTGAAEDTPEKRNAAILANRPPNSIKIPGVGWVSYAGIEPVATAFSMTADMSRSIRKGEKKAYPLELIKQVNSKTFLKSISDFFEIMSGQESSEYKVAKTITDFSTSWVPNLVRSPVGAAKPEVSDRQIVTQRGQLLETMLKRAANNTEILSFDDVPRVDYYGRPVKKLGGGPYNGFFLRLLGQGVYPENEMLPADKILLKWNDNHEPDEQYQIRAPRRSYTGPDGNPVDMTKEQYNEFAKASGEALKAILKTELKGTDNPTEDDIATVSGAVARSRDLALEALKKKWASGKDVSIESLVAEAIQKDVSTHIENLTQKRPKLDDNPRIPLSTRREKLAKALEEWNAGRERSKRFFSGSTLKKEEALRTYAKALRARGLDPYSGDRMLNARLALTQALK